MIDNCVDKTIPKGTDLYEGDEPPEPEGYTGLTLSDDSLADSNGTSHRGPVHVWVRNAELVPDFSSFTGRRTVILCERTGPES